MGPIIDEIFTTAWAQGRREQREQYAFDALIELAHRARNEHATDREPGSERGQTDRDEANTHHAHDSDTSEIDAAQGRSDTHAILFPATNNPVTNNGDADTAAGTGNDGQTRVTDPDLRRPASRPAKRTRRRRRRADSPTYLALLRIDFTALQRGHVEGDEVCEIAGVGPIPVTRARQLLNDSVIKLIATKGEQVANVTHYRRNPNTAQRMALLWSQSTCSVAGCDHSIVQIDHRNDWHKTHRTRLEDLDPLCPHHHRLKTHHGWALVEGTGKRPMVPPPDHRHPQHPDNHRQPTPQPA